MEVPTIEIQPVEDFCKVDSILSDFGGFAWVIFTSTNAVEQLFRRLDASGHDARQFHASRVAAIGTATASALRERGLVADLISRESVSQSLIDDLAEQGVAGQHILLPGAEVRPDRLRRGLEWLGAVVREVTLYRTVLACGSGSSSCRCLGIGRGCRDVYQLVNSHQPHGSAGW